MNKKNFIYVDNAATTILSAGALNAMLPFLRNEFANPSQKYSFAKNAKFALKKAREEIASCINALPEEIIFTSGGTESNNMVIQGFCKKTVNTLLATSTIEHHAVLHPVLRMEENGAQVKRLTVNKEGFVKFEHLPRLKRNQQGLVSVMLANNEIGTIQPIEKIAKWAHQKKYYLHTDAVQALGHIPINVKKLDVDFLSASAHKFNGPKGIGFLYIKKGTPINSLILGGNQEFGFRSGTENVAAIVGMAYALKENVEAIAANEKHIRYLECEFLKMLNLHKIHFVRNGAKDDLLRIPGNISLSFSGYNAEAILHLLDLKGVCASVGSACNSHKQEISHVLKAIHLPQSLAHSTLRFSFGKQNSIAEVKQVAEILKSIFDKITP